MLFLIAICFAWDSLGAFAKECGSDEKRNTRNLEQAIGLFEGVRESFEASSDVAQRLVSGELISRPGTRDSQSSRSEVKSDTCDKFDFRSKKSEAQMTGKDANVKLVTDAGVTASDGVGDLVGTRMHNHVKKTFTDPKVYQKIGKVAYAAGGPIISGIVGVGMELFLPDPYQTAIDDLNKQGECMRREIGKLWEAVDKLEKNMMRLAKSTKIPHLVTIKNLANVMDYDIVTMMECLTSSKADCTDADFHPVHSDHMRNMYLNGNDLEGIFTAIKLMNEDRMTPLGETDYFTIDTLFKKFVTVNELFLLNVRKRGGYMFPKLMTSTNYGWLARMKEQLQRIFFLTEEIKGLITPCLKVDKGGGRFSYDREQPTTLVGTTSKGEVKYVSQYREDTNTGIWTDIWSGQVELDFIDGWGRRWKKPEEAGFFKKDDQICFHSEAYTVVKESVENWFFAFATQFWKYYTIHEPSYRLHDSTGDLYKKCHANSSVPIPGIFGENVRVDGVAFGESGLTEMTACPTIGDSLQALKDTYMAFLKQASQPHKPIIQSTLALTEKTCGGQAGVNYRGSPGNENLEYLHHKSACQCRSSCDANPDCEYWVFQSNEKVCWLKKNYRHLEQRADTISGWRNPGDITWVMGDSGGNCDQACAKINKVCDIQELTKIDDKDAFQQAARKAGKTCSTFSRHNHRAYRDGPWDGPWISKTNDCGYSNDPDDDYNCAKGGGAGFSRICPCVARDCPVPDSPNVYGKDCTGANQPPQYVIEWGKKKWLHLIPCYNGHEQWSSLAEAKISTLAEAWERCGKFKWCSHITKWPDGKFTIHRRFDPDRMDLPGYIYECNSNTPSAQPIPTTVDHSVPDWCSKGIRGGEICCAKSCEQCEEADCSKRKGGKELCCRSTIEENEKVCQNDDSVGCIIPTTAAWMMGSPGSTCEQTCRNIDKRCEAEFLSTLTTNEEVAVAFLKAGHECLSFSPPHAEAPFSRVLPKDECAPIKEDATASCTGKVNFNRRPLCACVEFEDVWSYCANQYKGMVDSYRKFLYTPSIKSGFGFLTNITTDLAMAKTRKQSTEFGAKTDVKLIDCFDSTPNIAKGSREFRMRIPNVAVKSSEKDTAVLSKCLDWEEETDCSIKEQDVNWIEILIPAHRNLIVSRIVLKPKPACASAECGMDGVMVRINGVNHELYTSNRPDFSFGVDVIVSQKQAQKTIIHISRKNTAITLQEIEVYGFRKSGKDYYPKAGSEQCESALNGFCAKENPRYPYARLGVGHDVNKKAWRCYSKEALTADTYSVNKNVMKGLQGTLLTWTPRSIDIPGGKLKKIWSSSDCATANIEKQKVDWCYKQYTAKDCSKGGRKIDDSIDIAGSLPKAKDACDSNPHCKSFTYRAALKKYTLLTFEGDPNSNDCVTGKDQWDTWKPEPCGDGNDKKKKDDKKRADDKKEDQDMKKNKKKTNDAMQDKKKNTDAKSDTTKQDKKANTNGVECEFKADTWEPAWSTTPEENCAKWWVNSDWGVSQTCDSCSSPSSFGRRHCAGTCCTMCGQVEEKMEEGMRELKEEEMQEMKADEFLLM